MLGYMPKQFYAPHEGVIAKDKPATKIFYLPNVIAALIAATKIEEDPEKRDPETRRNAVHAMIHLISIVGLNETWIEKELISSVYSAMLECLNDYSIDNRGDVGSWVREAAIKALKKFIDLLLTHDKDSGTETIKVLCLYSNILS
jgi:HEAT repeat protein